MKLQGKTVHWDLDEHVNGCLFGYQMNPGYGAAVFFALEVLWGIARDVGIRAKAGILNPTQLDGHWVLSPTASVPSTLVARNMSRGTRPPSHAAAATRWSTSAAKCETVAPPSVPAAWPGQATNHASR